MTDRSRLRWLCRRGTKELDLLLVRFLDHAWDSAPPETQQAFQRLLDMQDPDLYALLTGRSETDDPALTDVVERIRATSAN